LELSKLTDLEIIDLYSELITELKSREIIRTKNLLGDLGEHLAIQYYCNTPNLPGLQAAPAGTQNIDAISRKGDRYSIKSSSGKLTGVFYGLNDPGDPEPSTPKFEFVILVIFDDSFKLINILELNWEQFLTLKRWHKTMRGWNLTISKKLRETATCIYPPPSPGA
jgi:hypothetical protein